MTAEATAARAESMVAVAKCMLIFVDCGLRCRSVERDYSRGVAQQSTSEGLKRVEESRETVTSG